jgi:uncharacterized membrane protein
MLMTKPGPFRCLALLVAALILVTGSADAHEKHKHKGDQSVAAAQAGVENVAASVAPAAAAESGREAMIIGHEDEGEDRSKMSTGERLLDWLGRFHTIVIHFPLAFFPAALFTALVGRRHPAFAKPVQFLVVAGGVIAPIAAILGWLDGGLTFTDTDPLLRVHRWLGTIIGAAAVGLAIWAWKRPDEDRRPEMVWALAALTAALIVQGWYGGAIVHGASHMSW